MLISFLCPLFWASQVVLVKYLFANAGDLKDAGLIPELGRSPWGGYGNPIQFSCLENPLDRGAWQVIVHRDAKSQTWLKWLSNKSLTLIKVQIFDQRFGEKTTSGAQIYDSERL